jgi:predicted transposase YbfD/YdcC
LVARLNTRVQRQGQWSHERVYLVSSRSLEQLQAEGMLRLKRGYWVIESRLHHCLDVTMHEDLSRVRNPNAARILGTIRRIVLSLSNAALDALRKVKPKTKGNTKTYRQRFLSAGQGRQRLSSLLFSKYPDIWTFGN